MIEAATVAAWLLAHPAWIDRDLTREEREPIVLRYAEAAVTETRSVVELQMLLAHGYAETKFAALVLTGKCSEMPAGQRCDNGKARGAYSLHEAACPEAYRWPAASVESIRAETRCAVSLLHFHAHRCREHTLTPLMAAFAGMGGTCHSNRAGERVMLMRRIGAELLKAEAKQ